MPSTTFSFFTYLLQPTNLPPVAIAVPAQQRAVIGAIVTVDARSSYDPEGAALTYSWTFLEVPIGSELTDTSIEVVEADSSIVAYTPDVVGTYRLQLTVNDGQFDSAPATAESLVTAAIMPTCTDVTPDARFIFRTVSDFWSRQFQDREVLPIVWSSYMQVVGAELLRLYEADNNKSIADIQDLAQRRWYSYEPLLELDPDLHYLLLGGTDAGTDGRTGPYDEYAQGILVGPHTIQVTSGSARPYVVGQTIEVVSSNGTPGNRGTYRVRALKRNGQGFILDQSTPLTDVPSDRIASASDLVLTKDSAVVRSASTNFAALPGFEAGDVLVVEGGPNRGSYEVVGIGIAAGLPTNNDLELSRVALDSAISADFTVYNLVDISLPPEPTAYTNIFWAPSALDIEDFGTAVVRGKLHIKGTREIVVGARRTAVEAIGRVLTVLGGINRGTYTIGEVNDAGNGYTVTGEFSGPFPQEDVDYELEWGAPAGRVLLVDGQAYTTLRSFDDDSAGTDVGVVVIDRPVMPKSLEDVSWQLSTTVVSDEYDLEAEGSSPGDLMRLRIVRTDTQSFTEIQVPVGGADRERAAVDFFTDIPMSILDLDQVFLEALEDLGVTGFTRDLSGTITGVSGIAAQLVPPNPRDLWGKKVYPTTAVNFGLFSVNFAVVGVRRHTRVRVDEDVVSIPCLREYIRPPVVQDTGERLLLLTRDGYDVELDQLPVTLLENRDYTIDDESEVTVRDGVISSAAGTMDSLTASFIRRRVRSGDTLTIKYGPNAGTYLVVRVLDNDTISIRRTDTGTPPPSDETGVVFSVTRFVTGRYLRFDSDLWTDTEWAPDRLWAETTYLDNSDVVEANFGVAVNLTKEQLSERRTAAVTYKSAVAGLMYAFINGPSVRNIRIGAQILLGLPVAVAAGRIIRIDDVYSSTPSGDPEYGRILIEDVNDEGVGTGIVRTYLFPAATLSTELVGVEENPATGTTYAVGDLVEKFAPLSQGVEVLDYIEDPTWWFGKFYQGYGAAAELEKFHKWRLRVNAQVTDPSDVSVTVEFAKAIKPAWTDLEVVMVLPVVDEVVIEDDVYFGIGMRLYDDIGLSLQATAKADNWKGSLLLHRYGFGPLAHRLPFDGYDLVTTAGSNTMTSARGGFLTPGPSMVPNPSFTDPVNVGTDTMVQPRDYLVILEGSNAGWYDITSIIDDNTLIGATPLPGTPVTGLTLPEIRAASGQKFVIARLIRNPLTIGGGVAVGDPATSTIQLTGVTSLNADGVTVDDDLVVMVGGVPQRYVIRRVTRPDTVQVIPVPPLGNMGTWEVYRRYLDRTFERAGAQTVAGSPLVSVDSITAARFARTLYEVTQVPGTLRLVNGASQGEYRILDGFPATNQVYVDPAPPANSVCDYEVVFGDPGLSTWFTDAQELCCPEDTVRISVYRPKTAFYVVPGGVGVTGTGTFVQLGANFVAAGVVPGNFIEVGNPTGPVENAGVHSITSVAVTSVGVANNLSLMANSDARILRDAPVFDVLNDTVTVPVGVQLGVLGVALGDVFEPLSAPLAGEVAVVAEVTGPNTFRLTRSLTGVLTTVTGRIFREEVG